MEAPGWVCIAAADGPRRAAAKQPAARRDGQGEGGCPRSPARPTNPLSIPGLIPTFRPLSTKRPPTQIGSFPRPVTALAPQPALDSIPALRAPARLVLPVFEGPLDLLLHLVKVHEMDIHDIAIAEITRQYIDYLSAMQELNLEVAGDFLVMAATLLNIKSRSLLPALPREEGEEAAEEEEVDEILSLQELVRRLVEYRKFKEISADLRALESSNAGVWYRAQPLAAIPGSDTELPRQDIRALYDAFVGVLKQVRAKPQHTVRRERFTVEEKILELREALRREGRVNCGRLFERCVDKDEVIAFFLALLEMAKGLEITIAQADTGSEILVAPWREMEPAIHGA